MSEKPWCKISKRKIKKEMRPRKEMLESFSLTAQKKNSKIEFTDEQEAVLSHNVERGQIVLVKAIAGAGKTATLIEYMRRRPHMRFLYLAYNVSAIEEVRQRLAVSGIAIAESENIVCRTIDSLAAGSSRVKFRGPKKWNSFWMYAYPQHLREQASLFPVLTGHLLDIFEQTQAARECGNLVYSIMQEFCLTNQAEPTHSNSEALIHARFLWQAVKSGALESPDFSWTVKAVAQLGERLDQLGCNPADIIIVDEAQDINHPMWQIVCNQVCAAYRPAGALLVGDPNQHLYDFRQCVSVFDDIEFPVDHQPISFSLSKSCRFGPAIANYANSLLKNMSTDMTVGTLHIDRKDRVQNVGFNFPRELYSVVEQLPEGERAVVLFQSNKLLWSTYVSCSGLDIEILGSTFGVGTLNALWTQYQKDPLDFSTSFKNKSELVASSWDNSGGSSRDPDAMEGLRDELLFSEFILKSSAQVPVLMDRLEKSSSQNSKAKIVFSTVHQSKGREFHTVILHPGIRESKNSYDRRLRNAVNRGPEEEAKLRKQIRNFNYLYYTAVTRAAWNLVLP